MTNSPMLIVCDLALLGPRMQVNRPVPYKIKWKEWIFAKIFKSSGTMKLEISKQYRLDYYDSRNRKHNVTRRGS